MATASSTSVTPAVTAAEQGTSTPTASAAGGSTWNSAVLAATGIPAGTPTNALADAVAILEVEAPALLDRLPFAVAAEVAWLARSCPGAIAWLAAVPARRLGAEASGVWERVLDMLWPVGQAMEVALGAGLAVGLGGNGGCMFRLERDGEGFRVGGTFGLGVSGGEGVGVQVGGVGGELIAGLGANAELAAGGTLLLSWRIRSALPDAAGALGAYLQHPRALAHSLAGELLARGDPPDSWRLDGVATGSVAGAAGETHLQGHASASVSGGVAIGQEADRTFVELQLGGSLGGKLAGELVDRVTAFGELTAGVLSLSAARGLTLRAEGAEHAILAGDFSEAEFVLSARSTAFLTETEDTLRTRDARAAAAWLKERLSAGSEPFGAPGAGRPAAVADLPQLTLVRSVRHPIVDLDRIDLLAPTFTAALTDALPDHGALIGIESADATGSVVVGPEAVAAAVRSDFVPVGESPEETVLAISRHLAYVATGGALAQADLGLELDLVGGVAAVEARNTRLVARAKVALGAAAELGLGVELEADAEASLTVERAVDVNDDQAARALLLG